MRTDCPDCPAGYDPETQDPDCPHYGKIDLMSNGRAPSLSAEDRAMVEDATSGQVLTAISLAIKEGETGAVVDLLGILSRKDPRAAELIVKAIQYRPAADMKTGA